MANDYEQFVQTGGPRLVRTARLLLGSAQDAEDVVQETLIVMYRRWMRLRSDAAAYAYAHRTLVRLARRQSRSGRARLESVVATEFLPEGSVTDDHEANAELHRALLRLPQRQREAIVLRYYVDLSLDETARVMGCTTGTVKSQVSRALVTLRSLVPDHSTTEAP